LSLRRAAEQTPWPLQGGPLHGTSARPRRHREPAPHGEPAI
jgi:hypothetical protein